MMLGPAGSSVNGDFSPPASGELARRRFVVTSLAMTDATGRDVVLEVFDRLFAAAARKLAVDCGPEERGQARRRFEEQFEGALRMADAAGLTELPAPWVDRMEASIEALSPADVAGFVAAGPLAHQFGVVVRSMALRQAEQRLLEHVLAQSDDTYGGN
jgi:hypothetical protein